jgi:hypothetical protein
MKLFSLLRNLSIQPQIEEEGERGERIPHTDQIKDKVQGK